MNSIENGGGMGEKRGGGSQNVYVTVAIVNSSLALSSCAHLDPFEVSTADCSFPDLWPGFTIFCIQLLLPGAQVIFNPVKRYGLKGPNDTESIIGHLIAGLSQLSPPYMSIQQERLAKLHFVGPLMKARLFVAYPRGMLSETNRLDLYNLYPNFILIPLCSIAVFYGFLNGSQKLFYCVPRNWKSKFHRRAFLLIIFFWGVFIGVFKTHLVVFFNRGSEADPGIRSKEELLIALESGIVTGVTNSPVYLNTLLNPVEYAGESAMNARFVAAAKRNPPILASEHVNWYPVFDKSSRKPGRKLVFVSDSYFLAYLTPLFCNFEYYFFDDDAPLYIGMYQSRAVPSPVSLKRPTTTERRVIEAEYQRLLTKYSRKDCPVVVDSRKKHKNEIALEQLQGLFLSLACLLAASVGLFCLEHALNLSAFHSYHLRRALICIMTS